MTTKNPYTPNSHNWRWYEVNDSTPLAAQNTKPTISRTESIILHLCVYETGTDAAAKNQTLQIEYSVNQSDWFTLGAQEATDKLFRWVDELFSTEHGILSSKLTCREDDDKIHEASCNDYDDVEATHTETVLCLEGYNPAYETTYYFRIVIGGTPPPLYNPPNSYPQVLIEVAPVLTYPQTDSRIANAAESWQGACDIDIVDWTKSNDFIFSTYATGGDGSFKAFKLQWKEAGGSFANVGDTTEINYNGNTSLVDGNTVGTPAGCLVSTMSEENEGDNFTGILLYPDTDDIIEIQWGLRCSGAQDGVTYEFQLVCTTDSTTEICSCSLTMEGAPPGWTGTIDGVTDPTYIDGTGVANISDVDGV